MRAALLTALLVTALLLGVGCSSDEPDRPDPDDCARLRDHVVELRLRTENVVARLSPEQLEQHRVALRGAAGDAYIAECEKHRRPAEVACVLAAQDMDSMRSCSGKAQEVEP